MEDVRFNARPSAGRLQELEGIIVFKSVGDCRHIQAVLSPQVMNMMPRVVLYLSFPLDTWAITKHLRGRLDATALNQFGRDEQNRLTMVGRQVMASNQLAGLDELTPPTRLKLEEAVVLMARECDRLRSVETVAPKRIKGGFVSQASFTLFMPESSSDFGSCWPLQVQISVLHWSLLPRRKAQSRPGHGLRFPLADGW